MVEYLVANEVTRVRFSDGALSFGPNGTRVLHKIGNLGLYRHPGSSPGWGVEKDF